MAAPLIPTRAYVRTLDTGETAKCGAAAFTTSGEISHLAVLLYKHGTAGGSEQLRVKVYADSDYTSVLYTGSWVNLSDITNLSTYWWGWVRLPLNRENYSSGATYYVAVETQNYTRNASTFYLSLSLNWPLPQLTGDNKAAMIQPYAYRDIT